MQRKINALWGEKKVVLRQTPRAVTPFGGLSVFIAFLQKIGYRRQVSEHMPVHLQSPNAINPGETFTAFLLAVVTGARRFAHTAVLRADKALHALLGIERFPSDDTIRNLFKGFRQSLGCSSTSRCGRGNWPGCRNVRAVTVWTWTRRCSSATGNRRERSEGTTHVSAGGLRTIRCWRCWGKRASFCTAGCGAGTRAPTAGWWSF